MTESIFSERVVLGDGVASELRVASARIDIEGAWIACVQECSRSEWLSDPTPSERTDLGTHLVCPAFVNAHTHVALNAVRGLAVNADLRGNMIESLYYRIESKMSHADIRSFARMGAYECLATGTGLVWDHYYGGTELAEGICDTGLSAVVAPTLQDLHGPGVEHTEALVEATESLDEPQWAARGIWSAVGPHATDTVSESLWERSAEIAERRDLVIHAHVAQSADEYRRAFERYGCSPIALLERCGVLSGPRSLLVHAIYLDHGDLERIDPREHTLVSCPLSQAQFAFPADVANWVRNKKHWVVATDCATSNDAMNVQRELAVVSMMRSNTLSESEVFRSFFAGGDPERAASIEDERVRRFDDLAELISPAFLLSRVWSAPGALHSKFRAGVVAEGALANLLVLDPSDPSMWPETDLLRTLALADTQNAIGKMMLRGRWRSRCGAAIREEAEYREAAQEATERLKRLLVSAGF